MNYKQIADAHLKARLSGGWDNPEFKTAEEVIQGLLGGKTSEQVMDQIETRYSTITSTITARSMGYITATHKRAVYKGFKILLKQYENK